jgi:hypothetical protein
MGVFDPAVKLESSCIPCEVVFQRMCHFGDDMNTWLPNSGLSFFFTGVDMNTWLPNSGLSFFFTGTSLV